MRLSLSERWKRTGSKRRSAAPIRGGHSMKAGSAVRTSTPRTHRVLLTLGAAGPVIFIATYLIDGAMQAGYSSWHDSISTLSLAPGGWIQIAGFVLCGLLTLCFAEGLRRSGSTRAAGFALLVVAGLCLAVIGPFRTDPVLGFPAGTSSAATLSGTIHNVGSLVVFLAFPAAVFVTTRRPFRGWAAFSVASGGSLPGRGRCLLRGRLCGERPRRRGTLQPVSTSGCRHSSSASGRLRSQSES